MEPKVSIIIPVYNVEPFLARCLDSVVGQTLRGIEIICVDDGSPDRSIDILNRYAAQDDRIRVISQENRGLGGARNRGFDAATGEFILFVDSDDWIDPAYCERLYEAAREAEADIACASMLKIRPSYSKWTIHYTERQVAAEAQEKFRLCRCPPDFYVMNKLLRREMLLRLGLRFRERVCYEDVEYTMRLLGEGGVLVRFPMSFTAMWSTGRRLPRAARRRKSSRTNIWPTKPSWPTPTPAEYVSTRGSGALPAVRSAAGDLRG